MHRIALSTLLSAALLCAAPHWQMRYFYDAESSSLILNDLQFPDPQHGIAVGVIAEGKKIKPTALLTGDGGRNWAEVRLPEAPDSLFFLNQKLGWIVGKNTVWQSGDSGRTWKRLSKLEHVLRVYFRDENRGWAVGERKSVYETRDGGRQWKRLPAADEPATTRDFTTYNCIAFASEKLGMIAGYSKPPRRGAPARLPDWIDPAERAREWPATTVLLETHDGGETWKHSESSMFGQVTRINLRPDGHGLALIQFFDLFDWPAEVHELDWRTGKSLRVFRRKNRVVTDIALPPTGPGYLVAIEPEGQLPRTPVPGKVRILRSENLTDWQEMPVDYRAVARRAMLASAGADTVWVATDTGMLLQLTAE